MPSGRRTNLGLLVLLVAAGATGLAAFGIGTGVGRWVVVAHGVAGAGLVVLSPWKSVVVGRGWRRARGDRWVSTLLGVLVVAVVALGVAHTVGWRRAGPVTTMQLHVGTAVALVPVAVWHTVVRPAPVRAGDLSRRSLLRAGGVLGVAGLLWGGLEGLLAVVGARGARRRFTGSHEVGSHAPGAMPVTQWLDDRVPRLDPAPWRLVVDDARGRRRLAVGDLSAPRRTVVATLDCTGGWYAEQRWGGVTAADLVDPPPEAASLLAVSATGYTRRFPIDELGRLLVATTVAGAPLSPGHGFPARLVAPGRRGFWWVKWLVALEASRRPWWWQPPFPLT